MSSTLTRCSKMCPRGGTADALVLGTSVARRGGANPSAGTTVSCWIGGTADAPGLRSGVPVACEFKSRIQHQGLERWGRGLTHRFAKPAHPLPGAVSSNLTLSAKSLYTESWPSGLRRWS